MAQKNSRAQNSSQTFLSDDNELRRIRKKQKHQQMNKVAHLLIS